jgi:beta-glucosidase
MRPTIQNQNQLEVTLRIKLLLAAVLLGSLTLQSQTMEIEKKVEDLLSRMTLEEKIGQMNQYNGFWNATGPAPKQGSAAQKYDHLEKGWVGSMLNVRGVEQVRAVQEIAVEKSRLGIPLIIGLDVIHGYKTISPIPLAESASWDLEAIRNSAAMAAKEAAAAGVNWTFAPMVDISRDARWGRVMEGAGEDAYLGSKIAVARVRGFQGEDLSDPATIAACAKHFAGYGFSEAGREYNTVDIGTVTLYNCVLPPFKAAKDAGVRTFMNGFSLFNGVPVTGNAMLQRDILKGKWGFEGFVVSDWNSIGEMVDHGYSPDGKNAAKSAVLAGSDMDMESYLYVNELAELVRSGEVEEALIDDAARRILRVKYELGLFDDPYRYCDEAREKAVIGSEAMQEAALDMARKSIVLLKNDNELLPLQKEGQTIALIGALAADKDSPLGSWRLAADEGTAVSVLEGMQAYEGNTLLYEKGADVTVGPTSFVRAIKINETDKSGFDAAVAAAKKADVAVLVLGEHGFQSGEARSRAALDLPGVQQELLEAVYAANPNVVLVLQNGRPLALPWAAENVPAIVEAWQLGTQSGHAIAQILYGDYNPSGKLPVSFPRSVGQMPLYYNKHSTGRTVADSPGLVFWSHYIDEENSPQYPFGHGLSYTDFEYSNLKLSTDKLAMGEELNVSVTLKNAGNRKGKEVVQLYLHDHFASIARPIKELKGFELVELSAGESRTVSFKLGKEELSFFNAKGEQVIEPGAFSVMVGGSSVEGLSAEFELKAADN